MARNYGGSGLGLAISKKLITLMGGEIHLESKHDSGSIFTFSLPVEISKAHAETSLSATGSTIAPSNKLSILLAEDNLINQEVAIDMIECMGHSVDIANNGKETLQMVQHNNYDIILMDCQMPVMDGFEAARELRRLETITQHRHFIIALTGNALIGDKEKCLAAGMDDFLSKPFGYDQLNSMLTLYHNSDESSLKNSQS